MSPHDTELIRLAYLREEGRIRELEVRFKGDEEFILTAIIKGWSPDVATVEYERRPSTLSRDGRIREAS